MKELLLPWKLYSIKITADAIVTQGNKRQATAQNDFHGRDHISLNEYFTMKLRSYNHKSKLSAPFVGALYNDKGKMSNTRGVGQCLDPSGNRKASGSLGCRPENPYGTEYSKEWANFLGKYSVLSPAGQVWTEKFVTSWLDWTHISPERGCWEARAEQRGLLCRCLWATAPELLLHLWDWCRKGSALCGSMARFTPVTHVKNKNKLIDNLGGKLFYQVQ